MKLGRKKHFIISIIFFVVLLLIMTSTTISYLYETNNITNEEYLKLLLSDGYGNTFYTDLVEILNKKFNPLNVIEMKEVMSNSFNLPNIVEIDSPSTYIYAENIDDTYKEEYNKKPNLYLVSYFLTKSLMENDINTIFEENNIHDFALNNNINIEDAKKIFINDKLNKYNTINYIIKIGRKDDIKYLTTIKKNNTKYALISLYANEKNIILTTRLNTELNKICNGISKIYYEEAYNDYINIDFGGNENTMKEVLNSIEIFSKAFERVIK